MKYTLITYIRKDRVNSKGECPINIRYTFNRKILNIPVGVVIKPENWDDEFDFPKQNKSYNFREIVKMIELKRSELEKVVMNFQEKYNHLPSIDDLKKLINNSTPKSKNLSVISNLEDYIQFLTKKPKISPNTIKVFKSTKNHYINFEKSEGKTFTIYDLNKSILESFSSYLLFQDLQVSSVGKYVKSIKTFLNKYVIEELNLDINQTFRNVKTEKEDRDKKDVLTLHELELLKFNVFYSNYNVEEYNKKTNDFRLVRYDLTDREILVGKIFLMLCSTGLSYIDLMKLNFYHFHKIDLKELKRKTENDINQNEQGRRILDQGIIIKIERTKLNKDNECIIPIFGITLDLITSELFRVIGGIELYGEIYEEIKPSEKERITLFWKKLQQVIRMKEDGRINSDKIFPTFSNQYFNREIKLLFKKIGVDGIESITKRDRKKTTIIKHKYDLICSHTGRRTYISINLQKGIRPDTLMKTTGHRSYETMLIYVQQQQDSIFKEMYDKIDN
jgi:integrase